MSDEEYDEMVRVLHSTPSPNCVVCRSLEDAQALAAWIEDNFPEDCE